MSTELDPQLVKNLGTIEQCIYELTDGAPPRWDYTEEGLPRDVVTGLTDVVVPPSPEHPRERLLCLTQWLGREAAFGEVAYGVRDLEGGPLVVWRAGAQISNDLAFVGPLDRRLLPVKPELVAEFADLIPHSQVTEHRGDYQPSFSSENQDFLGRIVTASTWALLLQSHAAQPA